nr:hypothetical protein [uncultured Pedobacter sp.]
MAYPICSFKHRSLKINYTARGQVKSNSFATEGYYSFRDDGMLF